MTRILFAAAQLIAHRHCDPDKVGRSNPQRVRTIFSVLLFLTCHVTLAQWNTSGSNVYYNGGNVGIGTSAINGKLHIYKSTLGNGEASIAIDGPANSERAIIFRDNGSDAWWFGRDNNGDLNSGIGFWRSGIGFLLSLRDNGNMGVGTTDPKDKLHIGNGGSIRLQQTTNAEALFSDINFNTYRDTEPDQIGARIRFQTVSNVASGYPSAMKTGEIRFNTKWGWDEQTRMTITADGSVGIGNTTTPLAKLQINDNSHRIALGVVPWFAQEALGWPAQFIGFNLARDASGWITVSDGVNNGAAMMMSDRFGQIKVVNVASTGSSNRTLSDQEINQNTKFIIKPNGQVGIGTAVPDSQLTIKGTVHAEEVKVDLSVPGPDYVFEEDYALQSLEEIESYVKQNKHLPDVPSAMEMEEEGIKVGEMNMVLLKKIEELTLHVIELKKEIELLKTDNK